MYLSPEEESILEGDKGWIEAQALRILVKLGEALDAQRLIRSSWAHLSGISYLNIGDPGLEFLEDWIGSGVRFEIFTTLNPAGMDLDLWAQLGISEEFARKQLRIIELLTRAGADPILSCIPHGYRDLSRDQILSWAESSAACYANFLGARTNRESGLSALASAITGRTPECGYHLDENRNPQLNIKLDFKPMNPTESGILGYLAGIQFGDSIPSFEVSLDRAQSLSLAAGLASSSQLGIFHLGSYPGLESVHIQRNQILEMMDDSPSQAVFLGCPHLDSNQLKEIDAKLRSKPKCDLWICCPRFLSDRAGELMERLRSKGAKLIHDTCLVFSPIPLRYESLTTDSVKAWHYLRSIPGLQVKLAPLERCLSWML